MVKSKSPVSRLQVTCFYKWFLPAFILVVAFCAHAQDFRPNIIIVMSDDMGYSDPGCYGGDVQTPNLDSLAYNGLRFTQFYNFSRCSPTRASLLTGRFPHQVGLNQNNNNLKRHAATIAELLGQEGYRTGMVGKWHLSRDRASDEPGCDRISWMNHQCDLNSTFAQDINSYPVGRGFEKHYGFIWALADQWDPFSLVDGTEAVTNAPAEWALTHDNEYYFADAITEKALEYIDEFTESEKPFFLYMAHAIPHWPIQARQEDIDKYQGVFSGGWAAMRDRRYQKQIEMGLFDAETTPKPPLSQNGTWNGGNWETKMMVHAAMVDRIDQGVGNIMDKLTEKGVFDNTLIFFLTDNGASNEIPGAPGFDRPGAARDGTPLNYGANVAGDSREDFTGIGPSWASAVNTPFRWWKKESYEGGICTPLIVHWPAGLEAEAGSITDQPGQVPDIFPTILEAAGGEHPDQYNGNILLPVEGISLMPILKGSQRQGHEVMYWEHADGKAVRQDDWKAVQRTNNNTWALYNLAQNRTETNDLAGQNPAKVNELTSLWQDWYTRVMADANDSEAKLEIFSPGAGEVWFGGADYEIVWGTNSEAGVQNVMLDYNTGSGWVTIESSTPHDGSHTWTVPVAAEGDVQVRVTATISGNVMTAQNTAVVVPVNGREAVSGGKLKLIIGKRIVSIGYGNRPFPASLQISDLHGRLVRELTPQLPRVFWDGKGKSERMVPSGIYMVRIAGSGYTVQQKIYMETLE
jgi:arylsulfatase